jgi:hypothetical protein
MMAVIIINHPNAKGIIYLLPTSTPWTYAGIDPFLVGKKLIRTGVVTMRHQNHPIFSQFHRQ